MLNYCGGIVFELLQKCVQSLTFNFS